jgi:Protein of unknown function (DUF4235)
MSKVAAKIAYKPVGLILGVAASYVSGKVFTQVWKRITYDENAPSPTDEGRGWSEILLAAALHGVIFALVRAAVDKAGAEGVRKATGDWPA